MHSISKRSAPSLLPASAGFAGRFFLMAGTGLLLGSAAPAGDRPAGIFPGVEWRTAAPETQGVDAAKLAAAMDYLASICGPAGVHETVVVRNGVILWQGDRVRHRGLIWSCTKSFLSTCLGLLWDDGKCAPSDPAWKYFPELKADYPDVTLEHLATFTSGYDCAEGQPLEPLPPMYKPGAAMHYSAQSDLLAAILTRIAGESLESLFMRRIGREIGLNDESFHWDSKGAIDGIPLNGGSGFPGSGVQCSALGLARFGWFYASGGVWNGKRLISRRYIDYATVPRVPPALPPHDPNGWYKVLPGSYGLNWWVNGTTPQGRRMWPHAPVRTFAAQGNNNAICFIVPDWNLVVVRLGNDRIIDTDLYDGMFVRLGLGAAAGAHP